MAKKEIKGNDFFKRTDSIKEFAKLFEEAKNYLLCPTYSIVEKKYALVIYMVECFLDPENNKMVSNQEFWGEEGQRDFADKIYENLTHEEFQSFNEAILSETKESYEMAIYKIVTRLYACGENELAE